MATARRIHGSVDELSQSAMSLTIAASIVDFIKFMEGLPPLLKYAHLHIYYKGYCDLIDLWIYIINQRSLVGY